MPKRAVIYSVICKEKESFQILQGGNMLFMGRFIGFPFKPPSFTGQSLEGFSFNLKSKSFFSKKYLIEYKGVNLGLYKHKVAVDNKQLYINQNNVVIYADEKISVINLDADNKKFSFTLNEDVQFLHPFIGILILFQSPICELVTIQL